MISTIAILFAAQAVTCRPYAKASDQTDETARAQYPLNRITRDVTIDRVPLVRVRCWLRNEASGDSKLIEFDPGSTLPPARRVYLKKKKGVADNVTMSCAAEARTFECGQRCKGELTYKFDGSGPITATVIATPASAAPSVPPSKISFADPGVSCGPTIVDLEHADGPALAHARSLDALTPLINDLLTTIAQVAIERARQTAVAEIRRFLSENICDKLRFENAFGREGLTFGEILSVGARDFKKEGQILPRTCEAIRSIRIEDLAGGASALERALGADLLDLCARLVEAIQWHPLIPRVIRTGIDLVISLLEGRSISSERDVQLLLLEIGSFEVFNPRLYEWKAPLSMAFAVMAECIRDGGCTADRLKSSLLAEIQNPTTGWEMLPDNWETWPELPSIMARAIDVLQPPTGTTARMTVKATLNLVFDILDHLVTHPEEFLVQVGEAKIEITRGDYQASLLVNRLETVGVARDMGPLEKYFAELPKNTVTAARTLANAAVDRELSHGLVAAFSLLGNAIAAYCATQGDTCLVPLTAPRVQKTFALLNALISYASSYREQDTNDENGDDNTAEIEALRLEQRKKAMEQLLDTFADRTNRIAGETIVSAGVGVGFAVSSIKSDADAAFRSELLPALSLPLGIGIEYTSNPGVFLQIIALDVAQYANVDTHGQVAEANPATALYFGGTVGVRIGSPSIPFLIAVSGGYSPGLKLNDGQDRGMTRIGIFGGTYIPFIDFN